MMVVTLRLLGVLTIFSFSLSAYTSVEEKKAWKSCLIIEKEKQRKSCIVQFEKKFYPNSIYNDEELHWSDIDWGKHS
jgi:hypothetical protein